MVLKLRNADIREALKENGVYQYEVAERLHITEAWLSKKFRKELPEDEKKIIFEAITEICAEHEREAG